MGPLELSGGSMPSALRSNARPPMPPNLPSAGGAGDLRGADGDVGRRGESRLPLAAPIRDDDASALGPDPTEAPRVVDGPDESDPCCDGSGGRCSAMLAGAPRNAEAPAPRTDVRRRAGERTQTPVAEPKSVRRERESSNDRR